MANSGTVTAGSAALASQYNNLRADVLNVSTGHTHTGASENGAKVAATGVSSGTAALNAILTADGSGGASFLAAAAAGADVQEFTSSGSWVKPAGKSAVFVFAVGAGGGGAGGARTADSLGRGGQGGGGGAHSARWLVASTLAGTVTVTIGAGGAGGTALASGTNTLPQPVASPGGNSTFGTVVSVDGGFGGGTASRYLRMVGSIEYGYLPPAIPGTAGGTTDASDVNENVDGTFTYDYFTPGQGAGGHTNATGAMTRTAGGGGGGLGWTSSLRGGGAGGRGFGAKGTVIPNGGASGSVVAGVAAQAGSVVGFGLGHGGGGGGGAINADGAAGGAGYIGGGGGGGGGVQVTSGSAARVTGAGGSGGAGYMLVISV